MTAVSLSFEGGLASVLKKCCHLDSHPVVTRVEDNAAGDDKETLVQILQAHLHLRGVSMAQAISIQFCFNCGMVGREQGHQSPPRVRYLLSYKTKMVTVQP